MKNLINSLVEQVRLENAPKNLEGKIIEYINKSENLDIAALVYTCEYDKGIVLVSFYGEVLTCLNKKESESSLLYDLRFWYLVHAIRKGTYFVDERIKKMGVTGGGRFSTCL